RRGSSRGRGIGSHWVLHSPFRAPSRPRSGHLESGRWRGRVQHAGLCPSSTRQKVSVQSKVKRSSEPWPSREQLSEPVISNCLLVLKTESTDGTSPPEGAAWAQSFRVTGGASGSAKARRHPQLVHGFAPIGSSARMRRAPSS